MPNWLIWLSVWQIVDDALGYQTTGRSGIQYKIDKKATKEYMNSQEYRKERSTKLRNLELHVLLLTYMMNEDDQKITLDEKTIIKEHIKRFKHHVEEKDIKRMKSMIKERYDVDKIVKHVMLNDMNETEVSRGIGLLSIINKVNPKYTDIIDSIKLELDQKIIYNT